MCLSRIRKQYNKPSDIIQEGAKFFNGHVPNLRFQNQVFNGDPSVPLNQWIKADGKIISAGDGKTYRSGFHVYVDDKEAKTVGHASPTRVYIRKVHTVGEESGTLVLIAEEMYVPSNKSDWPPTESKESLMDKLKRAAKKSGSA